MPIEHRPLIKRADARREPHTLFVFGDNLLHKGLGSLAKELRGEPNAVGIATKREPNNGPTAFARDEDLPLFLASWTSPLETLKQHLLAGGTVVFPARGIGTGPARLHAHAPAVWAHLQSRLSELERIAHVPDEVRRDPRLPRRV